jgi:ATP-binding cassette subfamily B protein
MLNYIAHSIYMQYYCASIHIYHALIADILFILQSETLLFYCYRVVRMNIISTIACLSSVVFAFYNFIFGTLIFNIDLTTHPKQDRVIASSQTIIHGRHSAINGFYGYPSMKHGSFARNRIVDSLRLGRALRLMWLSGPKWMIANLGLLVLQGILPLAILYMTKLVIDIISSQANHTEKIHNVLVILGISAVIALVLAISRSIAELVFVSESQAITDYTHNIIHEKSTTIDLEYYDNPTYHDILHRALGEASFRPTRIASGITLAGQNIISLLAVTGLLLVFNWKIALVLYVAAVPGILVRAKYARQLFEWYLRVTQAKRQATYYNDVLTKDTYIKEIRVFGLGETFSRIYRDLCCNLRHARLKLAISHLPPESAAELGTILALFGSYAFIAYKTITGDIGLGDLVMFFQAFQRGLTSLQQALAALSDLYEDNLFLSSLDEFLKLPSLVKEPCKPVAMPKPIRSGVEFTDVDFIYPKSDRFALRDINLSIRPNEIIALVGENGSGKSTLVKLLCRLYDPTDGSVRVDGTDLRDFATVDLRQEIGVIFQDYARYNATAAENIWFGDTTQQLSKEKIAVAARYSGADVAIANLKDGYDTLLGKAFEDGEELSLGQWQKLALARAFLRDAQIIILDEPTSSMDPNAEYEFFENFRRLVHGRSAVIISHRFSTVKMADCIYVMQAGRIVESGTHDQLINKASMYASLFEKQAQYYK